MKKIVIYKSKSGFTKRYAEWISDELMCEIINYKEIKKLNLDDYDLVIYGGRVHAGSIDSLKKVKEILANKKCKLIVFATGATPITATEEIANIMKINFTDNSIPHFYMQSGLCYEKMSIVDKTIMKMLSKMLSSKKDKSDAEGGAAIAISKSHDISSKDYIMPLIDYVKNTYNDTCKN